MMKQIHNMGRQGNTSKHDDKHESIEEGESELICRTNICLMKALCSTRTRIILDINWSEHIIFFLIEAITILKKQRLKSDVGNIFSN